MPATQPQPPTQIELTAASTLHLLEARLHRLTYLLTGDTAWTGTPTPPSKPASHDETVSRRLQRLEGDLESLSARFGAVRDVLGLYDRFPDLFRPTPLHEQQQQQQQQQRQQESPDESSPDADPISNSNSTPNPDSTNLPLQTLLSIILSYASAIPETASRLTSLNDTPIPDAALSASLIELTPRMEKLAAVQEQQAGEVGELRVRTARVVQRFYE
ncbi:hypothetical protein BJX76DRAFT_363091, partial [Aspergillus varians]